MIRQPFIAARDSRHRLAALALYRALLRAGSSVPLPKDLDSGGRRHPIVRLLKKRFAKNSPLTSLRLIYDSMAAGYKDSPEHSEILRHLQERNETAELSRARAPSFKKPPRSKQRRNPPLLTKVSSPEEPLRYETTIRPLPKNAFVGERKAPVPGHTAEHLAFVRMKKPEPRVFSRALGRKTQIFRRDMLAMIDAETKIMSSARAEDGWDTMMNEMLREEGITDRISQDGPLGSYRFSAALSRTWWAYTLEKHKQDWTARGEAVSRLVEQERVLAKREKQSGAEPTDPEVARENLDAILADYRQKEAEREQTRKTAGATEFRDPFTATKWLEEAQKVEDEYLQKSMRKHNNRDDRQAHRRPLRDIGKDEEPVPVRKGPEQKAKIVW
ncbi:hypothetical protein FHETE_10020 [Fusarium heterosporum]|uniref:Complex 1 LYR protein domain-containing protein n=1 Tax=Fusarium heterosporum TaxID=42747 RepID=A0A8H5SWS1_FUSHE|nr:hypothetical protein FHETE_10020 [Fusarium heterosporum]